VNGVGPLAQGGLDEAFGFAVGPVAHSSPGPQTARFSLAGVEARFWLEWGCFAEGAGYAERS
jgi:hypothetical protein